MNKDEAVEIVTRLTDAYPGVEIKPGTIREYVRHFEPLNHATATEVVDRWVENKRWWPTVADIRHGVLEREGKAPPPVDKAVTDAREWLEWRNQQGWVNGSGYAPVEPDVHPLVVSVARTVGGARDFATSFVIEYRRAREEHGWV